MKNRKTIRLPDFDYSQIGEYFITICVQDRLHRLGKIENKELRLSLEGEIVNHWILNLKTKFPIIEITSQIIMPNHIHFIIEIIQQNENNIQEIDKEKDFESWRISRSKMLIPKIINYLKSNSAREINRIRNEAGNKFWQSNYYEHIIRNEVEYKKIATYIENNPLKWDEDKFNI